MLARAGREGDYIGDRPRRRRLLQPAAQRSRSVRGRLRDRDAAEQPVRQVEGAVLAAGVHRSAQVRHLCCAGSPTATRPSRRSTATSSKTRRSTRTSATLKAQFEQPAGRHRRSARRTTELQLRQTPWTHWFRTVRHHMAHPYERRARSATCANAGFPFEVRSASARRSALDRRHQLDAVDRWFTHGWSASTQRLRSSIIEGIVVFLSLFDENPAVHRDVLPAASAYVDAAEAGRSAPAAAARGTARNRPRAGAELSRSRLNPGLARGARRDAEAGLPARRAPAHSEDRRRIQSGRGATSCSSATNTTRSRRSAKPIRPATNAPSRLSRQARLIPIVATQSISSLRSALPGDESWRTLLQCFRTKIFLATSDEFTARAAADLCGRRDRLKAQYTLSEGGQGAHISLLTGRATAPQSTRQRQQELRAAPRLHLSAARLHRTAERAGRSCCRTTVSIRCRRSTAT